MPRRRKENKHLPSRVYLKHGSYHYVDLNNKWHRLGSTLLEAMAKWSTLIDKPERILTMGQLFDRYMKEVAPLKAPATYKGNLREVANLRKVFSLMPPDTITPVDIYGYLDNRKTEGAIVRANREKALLSHIFSMAIRWGVVTDNPCRHVKRFQEKPRKRYIERWEFEAVRNIAPQFIQMLMDFAYLTAQRISDLLKVRLSDLTEEGIRITQGKTGMAMIIFWSDDLRQCIDGIKNIHRSNAIGRLYLFCDDRGQPYTYNRFAEIWKTTIRKALDLGAIQERFRFNDIRAQGCSDIENRSDASQLLGHTNQKITERVYNRKPRKVKPVR